MEKKLPAYVLLKKQVGETPLVVLERYRKDAGLGADVSLAYAGRLDPMASGQLLVLIGDECKKQEEYFGLDKEYEFEVLFGFRTDTGDVLGIGESDKGQGHREIQEAELRSASEKFIGEVEFPYPKFSSKTVQGKPLHMWTLENRLDEIEIPTRKATIYSLEFIEIQETQAATLKEQMFEKINSIPKVTDPGKLLGKDFRRDEIRARWNKLFEQTEQKVFQIAKFRCYCSSGTYMRTLAEEIGKSLGRKSLAFSIHRSKIYF